MIKLIKKIDRLYLGLIFCDNKNVIQTKIIENNSSNT